MNDTNKIKIMHLLNTGKFSGAENVAISIIDNMKKDFDFILISLLLFSLERILILSVRQYVCVISDRMFSNIGIKIRESLISFGS